jgi:hypothetical protein
MFNLATENDLVLKKKNLALSDQRRVWHTVASKIRYRKTPAIYKFHRLVDGEDCGSPTRRCTALERRRKGGQSRFSRTVTSSFRKEQHGAEEKAK